MPMSTDDARMDRAGAPIASSARNRIDRRRFAAASGALLALAALGADGQRAMGQDATPAGQGIRRVRDLLGREVELPTEPRRVVALDPNRTTVNLVEIGLVPVGATTNDTNPDGGFAPVIADAAPGIERIGTIGSASLEKIATLDPDLIFYATAYQDIPVERLAEIAPTVTYEFPGHDLAVHLAFVGAVVGREEAARRVADDFAATVASRRETLGLDGRRVAACGFTNYDSGSTFFVAGPESVYGALLVDLGAILVPERVDGQAVTDLAEDLSLEVIGELLGEAEMIVATRYFGNDEIGANFDRAVASPLWRTVPAVARGDVAIVDVQPFFGSWGVRGLELGLADLAAQL